MFSIPYLGSIVRVPRLNVGLLSSSSKVSRLLSCLFGSAAVSSLLKFQGETSYIRVKRDDGGTGSRRSRTKSRYFGDFPHSQFVRFTLSLAPAIGEIVQPKCEH